MSGTTLDYDTWATDPEFAEDYWSIRYEIFEAGHNASASCGKWDGGDSYNEKWCYVADDESCLVKTKDRDAYWVECEGSGRSKLSQN